MRRGQGPGDVLSVSGAGRAPEPPVHPGRPQAAVHGVIDGQGGRDLDQGGAQASVQAAGALGRDNAAQRARDPGRLIPGD